MSFDLMRRRRSIEIVSMSDSTTDAYNNEVETPGEPVQTWAARQQLSASEDTDDRDQQARTFRYFLKPDVIITGRDIIRDAGVELRVLGEPEVVSGALGVVHHIEALATLTEG